MKISIDREYTAGYQVPRVKADIAKFKELYTEADVLAAVRSQMDFWKASNQILRFEAKAFPGGTYYGDATHIAFDMLLEGYVALYRIDGYIDMDLDVPNPQLCHIKEFKLVK